MFIVTDLVSLNPIMIYSYGFLLSCTTVGQASRSMSALKFGGLLPNVFIAGPTVAQLEFYFSSDYQ